MNNINNENNSSNISPSSNSQNSDDDTETQYHKTHLASSNGRISSALASNDEMTMKFQTGKFWWF